MNGYIRYKDKFDTYNSYFCGTKEFEDSLKFISSPSNDFIIEEVVLTFNMATKKAFLDVLKKYCFILKEEYFVCDDDTLVRQSNDRMSKVIDDLKKNGMMITPKNLTNRKVIQAIKFKVKIYNYENYENEVGFKYLANNPKYKNKENLNTLDRALDTLSKSLDKGIVRIDKTMDKFDRQMDDLENCFTDEEFEYATTKGFLGSKNKYPLTNKPHKENIRKSIQFVLNDDNYSYHSTTPVVPTKPKLTLKEKWLAFKKKFRSIMIKIYLQSEK